MSLTSTLSSISDSQISEMYKTASAGTIAKIVNCGRSTVLRRIKKLGIARAPGGMERGTPGTLSVTDSFEKNFVKGEPNECWLWLGWRTAQGYGGFEAFGICRAHRFSYELYVGPIPDGICVLHKCDNPPCVNPNHLFLGTKRNNIIDCVAKGRYPIKRFPGELHPKAKLTDAIVLECRERHLKGETINSLAREYGVTGAGMGDAIRGQSWSHL